MRAVRSFVIAVLAFVVFAVPSVALADGRVALVVGNSTYAHIGRLPNPDNDAADISAALRRLGFEVTTELDADRVELTDALRRFTRRSAGVNVSLVFCAGHGIEIDGVNYLVPVDAHLERDVDVRYEALTLEDFSGVDRGGVVAAGDPGCVPQQPAGALDAAHGGDPYGQLSDGSFADLSEDLLGDETLVAYAAADGRGRNSPYTAALLLHLETPLEIGLLFRRVRAQVLASTGGAQHPHEYHSLVGEHYLTRMLATHASVSVTAAAPADSVLTDPLRQDPPEVDVTELDIAVLRELAEAGDAEAAQTELGERYEVGRDCRAGLQPLPCPGSGARPSKAVPPGRLPLAFMYSIGAWARRHDPPVYPKTRTAVTMRRTRAAKSGGDAVR